MRHHKKGKKFHRIRGERKAFLRNLVVAIVQKGNIKTTEARAKAIRPIAERCIHLAKHPSLANRRLLLSRLANNTYIVRKLIEDIAPRYENRKGGYLRIVKSGKVRKRDGTRTAVVEFV